MIDDAMIRDHYAARRESLEARGVSRPTLRGSRSQNSISNLDQMSGHAGPLLDGALIRDHFAARRGAPD
jgi:hypothetical protein